ncbi:conserved hypothetical protein [Mucor ambiguus]|uniref:Uncharacterized protein n=1 Tax=Mucor ambiguus TaxID=91626 RepID=A0A0C9LUN0_9FUNG|nr:conserved hypothetical protein [Mucor ambiguus]
MTKTFQQNYGCIVGIDFGTTYSGCCYCYLNNNQSVDLQEIETAELEKERLKKEICDISDEDRKRGKKTPTVAIYDQKMKLLRWGNAALDYIKEGMKGDELLLQKFKLNLPTTFSQRRARQMFANKEQNITAQSLIATIDYYKILFSHAYDQIQRTRLLNGINYSKDDMRFIVTVPAVWNDTQRAIMRDIAYQAGLVSPLDDEGKLQIVNESLASTLYCEHEMKDKVVFQEGDIYITCDAGGGTVDIAAFVVTKSNKYESGLSRCQISADSGDKCGSTYIDRAMETLLKKVLYHPEIDHFTDEEKLRAHKNIALLMQQFSVKGAGGLKFEFGRKEYTLNEDQDSDNDEDSDDNLSFYGDSQSSDDDEIINNESKEYKPVTFVMGFNDPKITWKTKDNCVIDEDHNSATKWLHIPFDKVAEEVFDEVVDRTIQLLDMQIEKIRTKDSIKATFLVGGLGDNPYLNQRIREYFNMGKDKFKCGMIINSEYGDLATMRGAVHYGIESAFGAPQANIATLESPKDQLNLVPGEFDVLICYDIGYDFTRCLVTDLSRDALESPNSDINGIFEAENTFTLQVAAKMQYTEILSLAKADLRTLLVNHLKALLKHTIQCMHIAKQCTDQERYRYCLTLENSYGFFDDSNEMKDIAIRAGLLGEDENSRNRLLLIKREDAAALYLENQYFGNHTKVRSRLPYLKESLLSESTFLQVHLNSDNCHLLLYKATRITENSAEQHPRNVRCIRQTTFDFKFLHKVVVSLRQYVANNFDCSQCDRKIHVGNKLVFDEDKVEKFLGSDKMDDLEFSINSMWNIKATGQECCQITVPGFYFMQDILRPVIDSLASTIASHAVQAGIMEYQIDKVFLIGRLLQISRNRYSQIENNFILRLSECLDLDGNLIVRGDEIDQEVMKGALLYSLIPSIYTERIARRTYMVSFEAFTPEFTKKAIKCMKLTENQDRNYDTKSKHVTAGSKPVQIYYQPAQSPSNRIRVPPMDPKVLITKGNKIIYEMEELGIQKKFFTEEDAVVYASIYSSETTQKEGDICSISNLQKIHQFEVYLERQVDNQTDDFGISSDKRLHFNICTIPLKNEFKFEATLDVKVGTKMPDFSNINVVDLTPLAAFFERNYRAWTIQSTVAFDTTIKVLGHVNMLLDIATNIFFEDENEADAVESKADDNGTANPVEANVISDHAKQEATDDVVLLLAARYSKI